MRLMDREAARDYALAALNMYVQLIGQGHRTTTESRLRYAKILQFSGEYEEAV